MALIRLQGERVGNSVALRRRARENAAMSEERDQIDEAIETATERTLTAHDDFLDTAPTDLDAPIKAAEVRRRVEDLSVLAEAAVDAEIASDG